MEQGFSFFWWIENYSYFAKYQDEPLYSPNFTPEGLNETSWCLLFNSREFDISVMRSSDDAGPESVLLKVEISVMKMDGSILSSEECENTFRKGDEWGYFYSLLELQALAGINTDWLRGDTLGVRCRMWRSGESVRMVSRCTARTRIGIEKISFLHRVENFSSLKLGEKRILWIPSPSDAGCVFTSTLCLAKNFRNEEAISLKMSYSFHNYKLCTQKPSLINVSGNIREVLESDDRLSYFLVPPNLTRQFLFDNRKEYLPNDELSLLCECTFYTGVNHGKIEEILHDLPLAVFEQRYSIPHSKNDRKAAEKLSSLPSASEDTKLNYSGQRPTDVNLKENTISISKNAASISLYGIYNQVTNKDLHQKKFNAAEKLFACPNVQDDLKALYNDQLLTDIVFKTATKTFSAHKNVLCARSSVFRAMLADDMKEKNIDCIKVEDLGNETVQRLLLFLYSDSLEELQWESAVQLYYAADKYAIEKLKFLCSSFLVEDLSTSTASELLLLADTHNDTELKQVVEDFILQHEREVFDSDEWEKLSETNPHLVVKTMKLKYKKEKGGK
ncbi:unnamed protein product [Larinioides sclopetarius]|uniref:BTB domain-containing protein n=1 Tax=Larinioides sclopetarius TaxID=280406 RepID=A0AAV2AF58_9ARAC